MTNAPKFGLVLRPASPAALTMPGLTMAIKAAAPAFVITDCADIEMTVMRDMADVVRASGAALLVADDLALARAIEADGIHLNWHKQQLTRFRPLKTEVAGRMMIGADAGRSRHDAMTLGEAGADYVAFGIPAHVEDLTAAKARQVDLIAWWSDLFEIQSVGIDISGAEQAANLMAVGADFIVLTVNCDSDAAAVADQIPASRSPVLSA